MLMAYFFVRLICIIYIGRFRFKLNIYHADVNRRCDEEELNKCAHAK